MYKQICLISEPYIKQKILTKISKKVFELANKQNRLFLCYNEKDIIGFMIIKEYKKSIYISSLCIKENFHKKGLGKTFIEIAKNISKTFNKSLRLSVAKINENAIKFYLKHGFVFLNKTKEDKYKSIVTYEMQCEKF